MSPEVLHSLREEGSHSFKHLQHRELGPLAAGGRYRALFSRDQQRAARMSLVFQENWEVPNYVASFEKGVDRQVELLGKTEDPRTGQKKGKIPHEYGHTDFTPRWRLEELLILDPDLPIVRNADGSLTLLSYFASDVTPGFITEVGLLSRTKNGSEQGQYLQRMWPAVKSAYEYMTKEADIDQDGLIESAVDVAPKFDHNERDSTNSYDLEDGRRPEGPRKYLSVACIGLEALQEFGRMAERLGYQDAQKEAKDRFEKGFEQLNDLFWVHEWGYPTPLVFGDKERADFINDEALDGMFYHFWTPQQAESIVHRLRQPDMETIWGQRTRSRFSPQYYENGMKAYWNGSIWLHRVAFAAIAYQEYGYHAQARRKLAQAKAIIFQKGFSELECVDDRNKLHDYDEGKGRAAGIPQLFGVGGVLGATAAIVNAQSIKVAA